MTTVTVEGSKNNFKFGPDRLEIPDRLGEADEAAAVIDAPLPAVAWPLW